MVKERTVVAIDGSVVALEADTICVHGDTPGSDDLAAKIRAGLEAAGVTVKAIGAAVTDRLASAIRQLAISPQPSAMIATAVRLVARSRLARAARLRRRRARLDARFVRRDALRDGAARRSSTIPTLHLSFQTNGLLGSITQLAAAAGGIVFAVIADRLGRKRALMGAILMYSIFTAACGFSQTVTQLAVFRVFLGLGMGGEWATGAALVSESFPARHRGKALAFVQSSWAIGYGLAALVNLLVMPIWGWRGVFFVGVLPALFTHVDPPQRRGAEDLARHGEGGSRPHQPALHAADRQGHGRSSR